MLPAYDFTIPDDDVIEVGDLRLRTIHTPGHTRGSTCFLLEGHPVLFSGDTLFPGGPGNTKYEGASFPQIIAVDRPPPVHVAGRHPGAAGPRPRHDDRHRAPPPPGVGRPRLVPGRERAREELAGATSAASATQIRVVDAAGSPDATPGPRPYTSRRALLERLLEVRHLHEVVLVGGFLGDVEAVDVLRGRRRRRDDAFFGERRGQQVVRLLRVTGGLTLRGTSGASRCTRRRGRSCRPSRAGTPSPSGRCCPCR